MKPRFGRRASACLAAAGLAVVVIVWTEKSLWRRADELRARAAWVNSERFHLSEPLEVKLRSLNDLVFRYSLDAQAPAGARINGDQLFVRELNALTAWQWHKEAASPK